MKRFWILPLVVLLLAIGLVGVFMAGGSSGPSPTVSASANRVAVRSETPLLPENLERSIEGSADAFGPWPMRIRETDDGEVLFMARDDFVRSQRAALAQHLGLEFAAGELLAPLRNEAGDIVGYEASNVSRMITIDEAKAPGFDLCALQAQNAEDWCPKR